LGGLGLGLGLGWGGWCSPVRFVRNMKKYLVGVGFVLGWEAGFVFVQ
jgi:hypothetical protein